MDAAVPKPVHDVLRCDAGEGFAHRADHRVKRPRFRASDGLLDLRTAVLDGREVGRVRRQPPEVSPCTADQGTDGGCMGGMVIGDHKVMGLQVMDQALS